LQDSFEDDPAEAAAFVAQQSNSTRYAAAYDSVYEGMTDPTDNPANNLNPGELSGAVSPEQVQAYFNKTIIEVDRNQSIADALQKLLPDTPGERDDYEDSLNMTYVCCTALYASACKKTTGKWVSITERDRATPEGLALPFPVRLRERSLCTSAPAGPSL
jgi:hypothetical protein